MSKLHKYIYIHRVHTHKSIVVEKISVPVDMIMFFSSYFFLCLSLRGKPRLPAPHLPAAGAAYGPQFTLEGLLADAITVDTLENIGKLLEIGK